MNPHATLPLSRNVLRFLALILIVFTVGLLLMHKRWNKQTLVNPKAIDMLPARTRILAETSPESVEESIDNLPSFTDWALATAIGMDSCPFTESYCRARLAFPRLNRVRKLLAQIDDSQKSHYTAVFLRKIDESMTGFAESQKEMLADFERVRGGATISEPRPYDRKWATAGALVYILTEWDRHDALPTFARVLEQTEPIPINRLFLLYSCHVLIEALPTDGFSPEKLAKLKEYKQLAEKPFPNASRVRLPAWNAKYEETDFRAVIVGQKIPIDSEPSIEVRIYPNLSSLEEPNTFQLRPEADALQRVMLSFLRMK